MPEIKLVTFEGDGIGPDVTKSAIEVSRKLMEAVGVTISIKSAPIGFPALESLGTTFPDTALELAREADGIILGPVSHLDYPSTEEGGINPSGALRRELDLYANVRPAKTFEGV